MADVGLPAVLAEAEAEVPEVEVPSGLCPLRFLGQPWLSRWVRVAVEALVEPRITLTGTLAQLEATQHSVCIKPVVVPPGVVEHLALVELEALVLAPWCMAAALALEPVAELAEAVEVELARLAPPRVPVDQVEVEVGKRPPETCLRLVALAEHT